MNSRPFPTPGMAMFLGVALLGASLAASPARPRNNDDRVFNELVTGSPSSPPSRGAALALLEKLVTAGRAELARPDANPADIGAVAATLGDQPEAHFTFVRDQVRTEPYAGLLRGAAGTLACRAGNSADKSRLLAELLRARGFECRLMRGTLTPAAAQKVIAAFLQQQPSRSTKPERTDDALRRLAESTGLNGPHLEQSLKAMAETARVQTAALDATTGTQAEWLRSQLATAKIPLGQTHEERLEKLAQAVADHFWVQLRAPGDEEKWIDLDPSMPAANAGTTYAEDGVPVEGDPTERHALEFKLVYVRTVGGGSEEKTLLEMTVSAERGLTEHGVFAIQPADPVPSFTEMARLSPEDYAAYWKNVKNYRAYLRFGSDTVSSASFDLSGNVNTGADGSPGSLTQGFGAFGFGGEEEEPAEGEKAFVELVAVLTLTGPGAPARPQRRVLCSATELGRGKTVSPALVWQILLQPGEYPEELAGYAALRHNLDTIEPLLALIKDPAISAAGVDAFAAGSTQTFAALPAQLAMERQNAIDCSLAKHPGLVAFYPSPQLTLFEQRVCTGPGGCGRARIDIVENSVSFVPRDAAGETAAVEAAIEQGVFDTVAEARLLAGASGGRSIESPIDAFEAARKKRGALSVHAATDEIPALPADDRAWIAACEDPGRLIITLPGSSNVWWTLDPRTGTILGRAHGGGGQAMAERNAEENKVLIESLQCVGNIALSMGRDAAKERKAPGEKEFLTGAGSLGMCILHMNLGIFGHVYGKTRAYTVINNLLPWLVETACDALIGGE